MTDFEIRRVDFLYYNWKQRRKIKVTFTDGEIAYIQPCWEGWETYHCDFAHKQKARPIAEKFNGYLHGRSL